MSKKISDEIIKLFTEIRGGLDGYWPDSLGIDRVMIETKTCPKCRKPLEYRGFSNMTEYKAFGVCADCLYAKHFWTEKAETAVAKKQISKMGKGRKSEKRAA